MAGPDGWTLGEDLELAQRLAGAGAEVALGYFGGINRTQIKPDGTPVGEADLAVDRLVLEGLERWRPGDGVLSEESGERPGGARRWIVDPIDGTTVFLAGEPHWGTHLALEQDGEIVVAVVSRPVLGELWWAVRGRGAHRDRLPARWERQGRGRPPGALAPAARVARVARAAPAGRSRAGRLRSRCAPPGPGAWPTAGSPGGTPMRGWPSRPSGRPPGAGWSPTGSTSSGW